MEKNFDVFLGQNVAYETLVQFMKLWTLFLISVLRYRGSNLKNTGKLRFFKNSFSKKPMKPKFFRNLVFGENVA